ncbi:phosphotransferase [Vibrio ziniensis]|uniref:Phosphotransferase n=1 Tax=Vibrio ziniensis TaxID=2711221 RepID=A0A6G7CGP5_9VIBR|nr:phosphotransferase [Vibrio ziniensis]QIH41321.1 phosphotransferase [Vibrio ziniensis]
MARMSWHEACHLDTTLQSVAHFFPLPPEYAQTLTGGLTNRCWKVVSQKGKAYVWRPTTAITKAFSISRLQEHQILKAIEPTHIGPKPEYISDQGLLVEWVEGASLHHGIDFDSLLKIQTKIHAIDATKIPVVPFSFSARIDHYWFQIKDNLKTPEFEKLYKAWRNPPGLTNVGSSLCHFDLAGYNMVRTDEGLKVIDWEYASIADPRMDLALSIDVAGENPVKAIARYCQLREIEDIDPWIEGAQAWLPRTTVMAMLWYLLAFQLWGDEYYYHQALKIKETFCS